MTTLLARARAFTQLPQPQMRRAIRERVGRSQAEVAEEIEARTGRSCDRATVSRWEAGARNPRGELLVAYTEVLEELRALP